MPRPYKENAIARELQQAQKNVARTRTTKKLAQRIDLNYFKRPTPLKRAKFWLSLLLPLLALVWITERTIFRDSRVYSSGRLSEAHAVLEKDCAACHVQTAGAFSAKAADKACLDCHDGPVHHAALTATPACATCHSEHQGRINLAAARSQTCAECHSDLRASRSATQFASNIQSFEDGHPEFAALCAVAGITAKDPGTVKLNHAIHLKPIRRGPNGPNVQLECGNCHRADATDADLTYADPRYRAATVSYKDVDEILPLRAETLKSPRAVSGRELMAPVKFANACAACHLLTFDKRFDIGAPHDKPEIVHAFLVRKFAEYINAHPGELRETQDPERDLTGKPLPPRVRSSSPSQWIAEKTAVAEELLWHKTCAQCHTINLTPLGDTRIARWSASNPNGETRFASASQADSSAIQGAHSKSGNANLPTVAPANITLQWMPHSKFDHAAHTGFTCVSCHAKALTSTESSDVLIPGIATCQTCHAPGPEHAESRCFECHTYHDWSKRKEVTPRFTLPALRTGGR
jgi:hypothetical protein